MSAPEPTCRTVRLNDSSEVRVHGHLPAADIEALAAAVRDDEDRRCHAPSTVQMPEIAQRIHGRETYWCGLYRGHEGKHRWPESGHVVEWGDS